MKWKENTETATKTINIKDKQSLELMHQSGVFTPVADYFTSFASLAKC